MLQNSFEVFLQILIPALKISQQDRKLLVEDPSEFVNISLDICEDFESKSIQTCSAQLMLAIDKSVDGMQTFMIDFVLNLLEKVIQKSNKESQEYINSIMQKFGLQLKVEEEIIEVCLLILSILHKSFTKRPDLCLMLD
jgi:importin-8